MSKIIVNKFGGGILIKKFIPLIKQRLEEEIQKKYLPVIVVSAFKGITDEIISFLNQLESAEMKDSARGHELIRRFLENLARSHEEIVAEVVNEEKKRNQINSALKKHFSRLDADLREFAEKGRSAELEAKITAYGERLSAVAVAGYLNSAGMQAKEMLSEDIPIVVDDNYKDADIEYEISKKNIRRKIFGINFIPVISGFTGRTKSGDVAILGRGGTDTTACFVAAALEAKKVILWKDVGGVLSADPKIVPNAKTIPFLNCDEVEEAGKIIHAKAIRYIEKTKIPAEIAALTDPRNNTKIVSSSARKMGAKIVSYKQNLTLFSLMQGEARGYEHLFEIGKIFSSHKVNIVLIWNTPDSMQIVAENNYNSTQELVGELKQKAAAVTMSPADMVTLVGSFNWKHVNEFNKMLYKLEPRALVGAYPYPNCIRMEGIIRPKNLKRVLRALHDEFIK